MKNKDFYKEMALQEREKRTAGEESTADLYRAVCNHFKRFNGDRALLLSDVTPEVVHSFVEWLKEKDLQMNSVNSYISNLRAMYNRACLGWKKKLQVSPFTGLRLKREETRKRAVSEEVIGRIASLDLKEEPEKQLAADIALFSFVACGIPFVDIVHLTQENLTKGGTVLSYHRQKTGALVELEVSQVMRHLIDRNSSPDAHYLFPVLTQNTTHEQYKYCLAKENRYLKEIGLLLNLEEMLTTYVFRHTWASEAYHRNVSIGIISQALGHRTEQMTRTYLSAFSIDKIAEANQLVSGRIELLVRG